MKVISFNYSRSLATQRSSAQLPQLKVILKEPVSTGCSQQLARGSDGALGGCPFSLHSSRRQRSKGVLSLAAKLHTSRRKSVSVEGYNRHLWSEHADGPKKNSTDYLKDKRALQKVCRVVKRVMKEHPQGHNHQKLMRILTLEGQVFNKWERDDVLLLRSLVREHMTEFARWEDKPEWETDIRVKMIIHPTDWKRLHAEWKAEKRQMLIAEIEIEGGEVPRNETWSQRKARIAMKEAREEEGDGT